jgi:hypothetical protein
MVSSYRNVITIEYSCDEFASNVNGHVILIQYMIGLGESCG